MNRLWVRFSLAFMAVIAIATIFPFAAGLVADWLFSAPAMTLSEGDGGNVMMFASTDEASLAPEPLLTDDEITKLAEILPPEKFDEVLNALYAYGYSLADAGSGAPSLPQDTASTMGVLSSDEVNQLATLLPPEKYDKLMSFFDLSGIDFGDGIMIIGLVPDDIDWLEKLLSPDEFNQLMAFLATDETTLPEFGGWEAFSLVDILRIIADGLPQVIIISGILGLALGIWMSRSLTAPLSQLTEAAKAIGAQDLSRRVEIKGSREIKELAQTLNQMAANLEQAEHLRRNMMADVSHELRTPLTVLEGNLRAALDRVYHLNEEDMAQLYTQTHHLTLLVDDLRELSLAEAKKLPLDFQETNVAQLVRETAALFKPLAQEKDISLTCRLPDNLPSIQVDPARIRQALHNLLANALRHTPPGGNIAIAVAIQDKTLSIAIEDNGAGIAPEHLNQVFERFYRADPARARSTGGAGLGLAIVKAIVEAHHGRVSVSSKGAGQGSAFTIYLPL